ncbi:MAG: STAS domain-containing protein [Vulcanococcus sp.]
MQQASNPASATTVNRNLLINLQDNFSESDIETLESLTLEQLSLEKRIRGILIDFTAVYSTDARDLRRLGQLIQAIRLLGRRIAICGINPGIAAVMIRSNIQLAYDLAGHDIDDILTQLKNA